MRKRKGGEGQTRRCVALNGSCRAVINGLLRPTGPAAVSQVTVVNLHRGPCQVRVGGRARDRDRDAPSSSRRTRPRQQNDILIVGLMHNLHNLSRFANGVLPTAIPPPPPPPAVARGGAGRGETDGVQAGTGSHGDPSRRPARSGASRRTNQKAGSSITQ